MIEFEHLVLQVEKLYSKEKSIRKRIYLETALNALKEYQKSEQ
ncbi:MAG: hypothetical protein NUV67_03745 [archaeon]|nr:hypothetical protein [archaeon]